MTCTHQIRKAAADASCFRRWGRLLIVDTGYSGSFVEKKVREVGLHRFIRAAQSQPSQQSQWINRDASWQANSRYRDASARLRYWAHALGSLQREFRVAPHCGGGKGRMTMGAETLAVADSHGRSGL